MKRILLLFLIFFTCINFSLNKKKFNFLFYAGLFINSDLVPISLNGDISYKKSYLGMFGLNYTLEPKISFLNFEIEGIIGKHTGLMNHYEIDGVFLARTNTLLKLPLRFAFGEGLSWASQNPIMENRRKGLDRGSFAIYDIESRQLLNFLVFELDVKLFNNETEPRLFLRLHHRSGIWGTYCPPDPPCGSNFLAYGIRLNI